VQALRGALTRSLRMFDRHPRVDWWVAEGLPGPPKPSDTAQRATTADDEESVDKGEQQAAPQPPPRARKAQRCAPGAPRELLTSFTVSQTWALCTCMSLVLAAFIGAAGLTSWLMAADLDIADSTGDTGSTAPLFSTDLAGGFRDATAPPARQLRAARAALRWGRQQEGLRRAAAGQAAETCTRVDWWTGDTVCAAGNRTTRVAKHDRWRLQLLIRSGDGGDLFSPLYLDKLRSLTLAMASLSGLGDVCRADSRSASGCAPIRSPLDFFYPSSVASSYNFSQASGTVSYFVQPADAPALPSVETDGVTVAQVPVSTLVFDGGGLETASLPWCIVDAANYDGTQPVCSSAQDLGLPIWAPPSCRPCTDHWCNCAPLTAGSARGTKQRVEAAASMLAATNLFRSDLAATFGEAGGTSSSVLRLDLPLGVPLAGFAHVADRREEQEELLGKWVTESLQPAIALQEAILGADPQPIELVVSIPQAASPWTTTFRGALVHDSALGLLAAGMPLLLAARHADYSGCLVFTMLVLELAAVGFAWVVSRHVIGVALYATSSSVVVLLLPLQFHSVTCLLDEWRNVILHDKLTANRGAAPKFATSIAPRPAEERNVADRIRFVHGRGTAAIMTVTSSATAAFLAVGFASPLPAVASCGIFAALILLVFSALLVLLFPCAMLLYHRTGEGRDGCCCCLTPIHTAQTPEPPRPGDEDKVIMPILPTAAPAPAPAPPPPPPPLAPPSSSEMEPLRLANGPPPPPGTAQGARAGSVSGGARARGEWRRREAKGKKGRSDGLEQEEEEPDVPTKQRCQWYELRAARWANHKKVKWASAPITLAGAAACAWWGAFKLEAQEGVVPLLPEWHTTQMVAERLREFGTDNTTDTVSVLIVWGLGVDKDQGTWAGEAPAPVFPLFGTPDIWSAEYPAERDNVVDASADTWASPAGVDLSAAAAQDFIQDTCAQLQSHVDVRSVACPLADFAATRVASGDPYPAPPAQLAAALQAWLSARWQTYSDADAVETTESAQHPRASDWPFDLIGVDSSDGTVRYIGVRLETKLPIGSDGAALAAATSSWQEWADSLNAAGAGTPAGAAVVTAEGGEFADAETAQTIVDAEFTTVVASIAAAGMMLIFVGCNALVVFVLMLSNAASMSLTLAATHWAGWMLGRSEVLWVSLLVGLLVGRPAHIAYSFTQASLPDRPDRVLQAVTGTGATCTTADFVCLAQGLLLWLAWAVPISRLGVLLLLGVMANAVTTHLLLLPALALFGPHGEFLLWHKAYLPLSLRPVFRAICKVGFCQCSRRRKRKAKRKDGGEMYLY
jgi:hypothetical protein